MPYTPDPDDAAAPLDTEYASSSAAEHRALKAKVNSLFLSTDVNEAQNAIYSTKGLATINTGGASDLFFGLLGNVSRTAGTGGMAAGYFSAVLGDSLTLGAGNAIHGALVEAYTGSTDSVTPNLYGIKNVVIQRNHEGQDSIVGMEVRFQNRTSALDGGAVVGGLGDDLYNENAVGILISAQDRSTATEKCGWPIGIKFNELSLDASDSLARPIAIDFSGIDTRNCAGAPVAFAFASGSIAAGAAFPGSNSGKIPIMINGTVTLAIPLVPV